MDDLFGLLIILAVLVFVSPLILSIVALVKVSGLRREIASLRTGQIKTVGVPPSEAEQTAAHLQPVQTESKEAPKPPPEVKAENSIWKRADAAVDEKTQTPPPVTPAKPKPVKKAPRDFSNWMVWVGGIALALGGLFILKVAAEQGYFGPSARIGFAVFAGLAMIAAGEWTRRKGKLLKLTLAGAQGDWVPVILASAGLVTLYGACYAAFSLYGMVGTTAAFVLLAIISAAAFVAAFSFGALLIVAGLVGAYVAPLLVSTEAPNIYIFSLYLIFPAASALFVGRYIEKPHVGWVALIGSFLWGLMLVGITAKGDELLSSSGYNLALIAIFALAACWGRDRALPSESQSLKQWVREIPPLVTAAFVSSLCFGALLILNVVLVIGGFTEITIITGATLVTYLAIALWRQALAVYALLGLVLTLVMAYLWAFSGVTAPSEAGPLVRYGIFPFWKQFPVLSGALDSFLMLMASLAVIMAAAGLYKVFKRQQAGLWGVIAAFAPVAFFTLTKLKIVSYGHQYAWLSVAFILALYAFVVVLLLHKRLQIKLFEADEKAMGLMAAAVIAAISLGLTFALEKASLTVAIAAMLPALAWIYSRYTYRVFRWVALFFAVIILGRIAVDPWLLSLPMDGWSRLPWVWFAYGLPLLFFVIAGKYFKSAKADLTTHALDIGRLVFASLTVGFSIRVIAGVDSLGSQQLGYLELALTTTAWLGFVLGLRRLSRKSYSLVFDYGWKLFAIVASMQAFALLTALNPVLTGTPVGDWPLFNALAFAYLAPAILLALLAWDFKHNGPKNFALIALVASVVMALMFIGLSIRHLFHGTHLDGGVFQSESLTYSAVGLAIGVGLFLLAHLWNSETLRRPALAILAVVAAKVFLLDTAGLDGLLRAVSFMGLGASLVGLGWLYQRGLAKANAEED